MKAKAFAIGISCASLLTTVLVSAQPGDPGPWLAIPHKWKIGAMPAPKGAVQAEGPRGTIVMARVLPKDAPCGVLSAALIENDLAVKKANGLKFQIRTHVVDGSRVEELQYADGRVELIGIKCVMQHALVLVGIIPANLKRQCVSAAMREYDDILRYGAFDNSFEARNGMRGVTRAYECDEASPQTSLGAVKPPTENVPEPCQTATLTNQNYGCGGRMGPPPTSRSELIGRWFAHGPNLGWVSYQLVFNADGTFSDGESKGKFELGGDRLTFYRAGKPEICVVGLDSQNDRLDVRCPDNRDSQSYGRSN